MHSRLLCSMLTNLVHRDFRLMFLQRLVGQEPCRRSRRPRHCIVSSFSPVSKPTPDAATNSDRQEFESLERRAPASPKPSPTRPHKPRHRQPKQQLSHAKEISLVANGMKSVIQEAKATLVPGAPPTNPVAQSPPI